MTEEPADRPADLRLPASDAELVVVATRLREAHAEGRLTVEEFSERLAGPWGAVLVRTPAGGRAWARRDGGHRHVARFPFRPAVT